MTRPLQTVVSGENLFMKKVILTGFEPFGGYKYNPTQQSALDFNGKIFGDREIIGVVLPCIYNAWGHLITLIRSEEPYAILGTGLASSVQGMRIESTFHNVMGSKYADAYGYAPQNIPIMIGRASPYTVKAKSQANKLFKLLAENDIPAEFSTNADGFICNALGYHMSLAARTSCYIERTLFVHVPWTTDYRQLVPISSEKNYLETELYYKGLELLIRNI